MAQAAVKLTNNPVAQSAKSGNIPNQSPVGDADRLTSENLFAVTRSAFAGHEATGLKAVATATVALMFATQVNGDALKVAKPTLAKAIDNVDDIKACRRMVREHVALAAKVAERLDANGTTVNQYSSIGTAVSETFATIKAKYGTLSELSGVFGRKTGNPTKKAIDALVSIGKVAHLLTENDCRKAVEIMAHVAAMTSVEVGTFSKSYAETLTAIEKHEKAAKETAAKRKADPLADHGPTAETVAEMVAKAIAGIVESARPKAE